MDMSCFIGEIYSHEFAALGFETNREWRPASRPYFFKSVCSNCSRHAPGSAGKCFTFDASLERSDADIFTFVIVHHLREICIDAKRFEIFMIANKGAIFTNVEIFDSTEY